jgi:hypothetical protein
MASIDEELNQIERDLRTLKIEYEQYFGGGRKRPPADTQWRIENLIKRHSERIGDLSYGQRFRYNNLTQTYAKYQEMWRKKLAQKETGAQQRHFGAAARAIEAERALAAKRSHGGVGGGSAGTSVSRTEERVSAGRVEGRQEDIDELYQKLLQMRADAGDQSAVPSLRDFRRFVDEKTRELRSKGAHEVEFTVKIEQGRAKLKARVSN